eukprot:SAG11_NODE_784_length_7187_cov_2.920429_1_plen_88_part_00
MKTAIGLRVLSGLRLAKYILSFIGCNNLQRLRQDFAHSFVSTVQVKLSHPKSQRKAHPNAFRIDIRASALVAEDADEEGDSSSQFDS